MTRHVAFLRAVNVGGRTVKMDLLKRSFEDLGFDNVSTFIASGNVVFDSARAAAALESAIEAQLTRVFGFTVGTMIRSIGELRAVQAHARTAGLTVQPEVKLHVGFLKAKPAAAAAKATVALSNEIDRLTVHGRELYWQAAQGLGQSTLSGAKIEKLLGTPATVRNLNTIDRIVSKYANG